MEFKINNQSSMSNTKLQLINGFISLLETESFDDINILQITKQSNLARRTFYLNFDNKISLLNTIVELYCHELFNYLKKANKRSLYSVSNIFFEFWYEHKDFLTLLERNNLFILLLSEFDSQSIYNEYFTTQAKQSFSLAQNIKDYSKSLSSTILWRILLEWVRNNFNESVNDISLIYISCIN